MADHLKPVAEALANPVDAPIDNGLPPPWTEADLADYPPDDGSGGRAGGREALDSGFASLASFNRAFRAIEGRSPSSYRSAARAHDTNGSPSVEAGF